MESFMGMPCAPRKVFSSCNFPPSGALLRAFLSTGLDCSPDGLASFVGVSILVQQPAPIKYSRLIDVRTRGSHQGFRLASASDLAARSSM